MSIERGIEGAIQEAMAAGAFKNLPGEGKPLRFSQQEQAFAGDNWLGFKMLENGGYVPEWLNLGREIELDLEALALIDRNHQDYCENAHSPADWARVAHSVDRLRESYEKKAREIRKKQDRFNHDAPGIRSQRAAIWVEYHLERLVTREQASGRTGPQA
jgi:DnaJ family protein C protein 28